MSIDPADTMNNTYLNNTPPATPADPGRRPAASSRALKQKLADPTATAGRAAEDLVADRHEALRQGLCRAGLQLARRRGSPTSRSATSRTSCRAGAVWSTSGTCTRRRRRRRTQLDTTKDRRRDRGPHCCGSSGAGSSPSSRWCWSSRSSCSCSSSWRPGTQRTPSRVTPRRRSRSQAIRTELRLDEPFFQRYWDWLSDAAQGDFGNSYLTKKPVIDMILDAAPVTLSLGLVSLVMALGDRRRRSASSGRSGRVASSTGASPRCRR